MNKKFIYVLGIVILILIVITFGNEHSNSSFSDVLFSYSNNQLRFADDLLESVSTDLTKEGSEWSIPNIIRSIVKGR